jgi:hypothetical protein
LGDGDIKIGSGTASTTSLPAPWIDPNGITFWDCPGFNDTKGFEQDIINAFFIKKIFDFSDEVKVIIVVSESTIKGIANRFIELISKLENLFLDFNIILESVCLVLTKTKLKTPEKIKAFLLNIFLPEQSKNLSPRRMKLIETFAS